MFNRNSGVSQTVRNINHEFIGISATSDFTALKRFHCEAFDDWSELFPSGICVPITFSVTKSENALLLSRDAWQMIFEFWANSSHWLNLWMIARLTSKSLSFLTVATIQKRKWKITKQQEKLFTLFTKGQKWVKEEKIKKLLRLKLAISNHFRLHVVLNVSSVYLIMSLSNFYSVRSRIYTSPDWLSVRVGNDCGMGRVVIHEAFIFRFHENSTLFCVV